MKRIKALSLFSNVGIAEAYFKNIGIDVCLANEIEENRAKFYSAIYPFTEMVVGDITSDKIKNYIIDKSIDKKIELVLATPPCQGMSTAGKQDEHDKRNSLICHAVEIVQKVNPKYVFFENVPEQLKTFIQVDGKSYLIPDYLKDTLGTNYIFNDSFLINAEDYGVPQQRQRAIFLLVRKDIGVKWNFPPCEKRIVTLEEAIGKLPILDPEISDMNLNDALKIFPHFLERKEQALKISKWFYPPSHPYRQILSIMHTPTGETAFNNPDVFKPKKKDGTPVKGFKNTYKRQNWNKPAFTITMYNRTISSQNNVHPGRYVGIDNNGFELYSDPRVLTIYELLIVSSLPTDWPIPSWATDHFIRQVIGEGVPPLMTKKIMQKLLEINDAN